MNEIQLMWTLTGGIIVSSVAYIFQGLLPSSGEDHAIFQRRGQHEEIRQ